MSSRFRVHQQDGIVSILGSLSDGTNLSVLDEMIESGRVVIDCSQLTSASWLGLGALVQYLAKLTVPTRLVHVPLAVFNALRLIPGVFGGLTVASLEVGLVGRGGGRARSTKVVQTAELAKAARMARGGFVRLASGEEVIGLYEHLWPADEAKLVAHNFSNLWCRARPGEFRFWFDFLSYEAMANALALDMHRATTEALLRLLRDIHLRAETALVGLQVIEPSYQNDAIHVVEELSLWLETVSGDIDEALSKAVGHANEGLVTLQLAANDASSDAERTLWSSLMAAAKTNMNFWELAEKIEDIGGHVAGALGRLKGLRELKQKIAATTAVPQGALERMRDAFDVLDPLSEGDWEATRAVLLRDFDELSQALSQCVFLFQGFDLLRQVIEHRIAEFAIVHREVPALAAGAAQFLAVAAEIRARIQKNAVTDQEKCAAAFFLFPEQATKATGSPQPGDVFVF